MIPAVLRSGGRFYGFHEDSEGPRAVSDLRMPADDRKADKRPTAASASAAMTTFLLFAFAGIPLQISVLGHLGAAPGRASSWIFISWFTTGVSTIFFSLRYRIPIPISWTIPGLIYLGALSERFSLEEIAAANLLTGILITGLGLLGVGGRIVNWFPLPIIMGMFAGSIFDYMIRCAVACVGDPVISIPAILAYLVGRRINSPKVPPAGVAAVAGLLSTIVMHRLGAQQIAWTLPSLAFAPLDFSRRALLSITFPMLVLVLALGDVQGIGFLLAQGFAVPTRKVTTSVGVISIANALFGGHPATIARTSVAILGGPEAGPRGSRYFAGVMAGALALLLALGAAPLSSLMRVLPSSLISVLSGLALLTAFQNACEKAFGSTMKLGPLVGFVVAASPITLAGIPSDFWGLLCGFIASFFVERPTMVESINPKVAGNGSP